MNKKKIIGGIVVIIVILGLFSIVFRGEDTQETSPYDAIDTVENFYSQWLSAVREGENADPDRDALIKTPYLSKELRERLEDAENVTPDPVLCQTVTPENFSTRRVYENEDGAQILVTSRDREVTEQAIVTLRTIDEGWYIQTIECSPGEFAPEREFSFEMEGNLLKESIPEPFDKNNWHLVFVQDGVPGHVAPLFFDENSQCTNLDGDTNSCNPDQYAEATKVFVQGQMSESGVSVNRLRLVE